MLRYTVNRLLMMIPTLIGVAVLVFFMLRVIPGDVVEVKLRGDGGNVSQETLDMERKRLGLDKPLVYLFNWLPPITFTPIYVDPIANLTQLIWPALAVGYRYCAVVARMIRSSLLEVLNEDYIRTARAKGVFEKIVISRHALRNALLPAITVIGIEFAFLIGGLVVTAQVFNLNGIGMLFVQSVSRNDFTLIQAMVMLIASAYVVINLVVDLLYAVFDPRIRYH